MRDPRRQLQGRQAKVAGEHFENMIAGACRFYEESHLAKMCIRDSPEPLEGAVAAVAAVFDEGQTVTDEPILFFYNPDRCRSDWHESQSYVMTICCHRFFKEAPHE